jgi:hypothetical protein
MHNTGICGAVGKPARSLKSPGLLMATNSSCWRRRNNDPRKLSPPVLWWITMNPGLRWDPTYRVKGDRARNHDP